MIPMSTEISSKTPGIHDEIPCEMLMNVFGASLDPDEAWSSVLERDGGSDGVFVYGVQSTKIYCRPSCPSRRPLRRNVSFFAGPAAAEAAGFRACRRCKPRGSVSPVVDLVQRAAEYLDAHFERAPSLGEVASQVKVSPTHLQKTFQRLTGLSPAAYVESRRMAALRSELERGTSVTDSIYVAGYGSPSRVYEKSDALLGMTPGAYRQGGKGVAVFHSLVSCELGRLLVAGTHKGICSVSLGDDDAELVAELRSRFPNAEPAGEAPELQAWVQDILALLKGAEPSTELPLDLRGTAFQWQVWNALRRIPKGVTRTYKEVAESLGRPKSARAVARACAGNTVALVIPCHRVVRTDGGLGGYRWGLERKRRLLETEAQETDNDR